MENNILKLKGRIDLYKYNNQYSICLRGARLMDKTEPLLIYTEGNGDLIDTAIKVVPTHKAKIVSQKHFSFHDVSDKHCINNYNKDARFKSGLVYAMTNVYPDFEMSEIVTILTFDISDDDINS